MNTAIANKYGCRPTVHPIAHHVSTFKDCVNEAAPKGSAFTWAKALVKSLRDKYRIYTQRRIDRAAFQHLVTLDDSLLDDIGVKRTDVLWASRLPLSQNAAQELEKIARSR